MQLILKGFCDIIKDKYIGSQYFWTRLLERSVLRPYGFLFRPHQIYDMCLYK